MRIDVIAHDAAARELHTRCAGSMNRRSDPRNDSFFSIADLFASSRARHFCFCLISATSSESNARSERHHQLFWHFLFAEPPSRPFRLRGHELNISYWPSCIRNTKCSAAGDYSEYYNFYNFLDAWFH